MNIAEEVCNYIRSELLDKSVDCNVNTSFDKLGLDSFSLIEIILFIERRYGITLPDKELTKENLFSAASLASCIEKYQIKK